MSGLQWITVEGGKYAIDGPKPVWKSMRDIFHQNNLCSVNRTWEHYDLDNPCLLRWIFYIRCGIESLKFQNFQIYEAETLAFYFSPIRSRSPADCRSKKKNRENPGIRVPCWRWLAFTCVMWKFYKNIQRLVSALYRFFVYDRKKMHLNFGNWQKNSLASFRLSQISVKLESNLNQIWVKWLLILNY